MKCPLRIVPNRGNFCPEHFRYAFFISEANDSQSIEQAVRFRITSFKSKGMIMKTLVRTLAAVGLILGAQSMASAQIGSCPHGGASYGYGSYGGGNYQVSPYPGGNFGGGYYPPATVPTYHNTTHFDYHPAQYVPHGNHYHYTPAHYDLHRTGHWHY